MTGNKLPDSVINLLKSTRFVHLATCHDNFPHVSLMNYTYYSDGKHNYIIITTPRKTTKFENMSKNPNVSLLVHDWISAKANSVEKEPNSRRNSLYEYLTNLNKTEISSVSVMINGSCSILDKEKDNDQFDFFKSLHMNNSKIDTVQARNYIENDNNALILVTIESCKVTDTDDNVDEYQ